MEVYLPEYLSHPTTTLLSFLQNVQVQVEVVLVIISPSECQKGSIYHSQLMFLLIRGIGESVPYSRRLDGGP